MTADEHREWEHLQAIVDEMGIMELTDEQFDRWLVLSRPEGSGVDGRSQT